MVVAVVRLHCSRVGDLNIVVPGTKHSHSSLYLLLLYQADPPSSQINDVRVSTDHVSTANHLPVEIDRSGPSVLYEKLKPLSRCRIFVF